MSAKSYHIKKLRKEQITINMSGKNLTMIIPRQSGQYKLKAESEEKERLAMEDRVRQFSEDSMRAELTGKSMLTLGDLASSVSDRISDHFGFEIDLHDVPDSDGSITSKYARTEKQIYNSLIILALLAKKHDDLLVTADRSADILRSNVSVLTNGDVSPDDHKTFSDHVASINYVPDPDLSNVGQSYPMDLTIMTTSGTERNTTNMQEMR